jgi:hypothetical protein
MFFLVFAKTVKADESLVDYAFSFTAADTLDDEWLTKRLELL